MSTENKTFDIKLFNNNYKTNDYEIDDFDSRVKYDKTNGWVKFGDDNLYPQKLVYLYENSPTHSAIIDKKTNYTAAPLIIPDELENVKKQLEKLYDGKGLQALLNRITKDYYMFGAFCLQVIFYRNRKKIKDIIYQDVSAVRRGFDKDENEQGLYDQGVYISQNWRKSNSEEAKPQFFKLFNYSMLDFDDDTKPPTEPVFLYHYNDNVGREWYPLPAYQSGLMNIFSEIESSKYIYHQFKNSFNPSGMLRLPHIADEQRQRHIKNKIQEEMQGTENSGKILAVFDDGENTVEWIPFSESFNHTGIIELQERNQRMIVTAHHLPSAELVGIPTAGASLGGNSNMLVQSAKEFYTQTIKPQQKMIFDVIDKLLAGMGIDYKVQTNDNYVYLTDNNE